jgi:hypothetical protein
VTAQEVALFLRNLADEVERRGVVGVTANLRTDVIEITDSVEEQSGSAIAWRCYTHSGHVELHLKFRYLDWEESLKKAIDEETERLAGKTCTEEAA